MAAREPGAHSAPRSPRRRVGRAWLVALVVAAANGAAWFSAHPSVEAPDVATVPISGLAYSPFGRHDDPQLGGLPADGEVRADLQLLRQLTPQLRTYSASEWPNLPAEAAAAGLRLTAGVWLSADEARNRREIEAIVRGVRSSRSIERVIVGNETQLQRKLPRAQLVATLAHLRRTLGVPISTAEPWHVWHDDPDLARHVDFITVHLLPYWEGVPHGRAVEHAMARLRDLERRFPGKRIVIGEFGWPSAGQPVPGTDSDRGVGRRPRPLSGDPRTEAHATPQAQAQVLREFIARAPRELPSTDYFLIEAFDQPWKRGPEGLAGAHWGFFDAARELKFALTGAVPTNRWWPRQAATATALGTAFALLAARALPQLALAPLLATALAAQALLSLAVLLATRPLAHYLHLTQWLGWGLFAATLVLLAATLLTQALEFAELFWRGQLRRRHGDKPWPADRPPLRVSVHLPCCNEPPAMVIAAIDSLCALDHAPLEILVIDNNTADPAHWQPVRDHVQRVAEAHAGVRMRYFHLPSWPGYKAGALNFALAHTDPRADVVAVVDADYLVHPDWLRRLLGHFTDATVAVVQSPQAHRGWQQDRWRRCMNWEYEGFFRIGMHHRNERGAIIQHGTVTLIRAEALRRAGGWDETCVCEDTELGLRLLDQGWRAIYVDKIAGRGLTPDDFASYKAQRRRWAQGAMQIMRRHAAALLLPGRLSLGQRYHFVAGWAPWWADALHLIFTLGAIIWSAAAVLWPGQVQLPEFVYLLPALALPWSRLVMTPLLYQRRVGCTPAETAGAMLAGMALAHSVARGVFAGLLVRRARFVVTRKGRPGAGDACDSTGAGVAAPRWPVREEAALLVALAAAAVAVSAGWPRDAATVRSWLMLLLLQALPYAAALACQALSARGRPVAAALSPGRQAAFAPPEE